MSAFPLNHPMITHEQWEMFTPSDHQSWQTLFERQSSLLEGRAAQEVLAGMQKLAIAQERIPKFSELNTILEKETDFSIVPVKGFIPEALFFQLLSERQFPSTCFIRKPHQLDYLEEPDIFHDVFGHIPLLASPVFADFMQAFGHKGLEAIQYDMLPLAAALYWFTVEFGLIATPEGARIYGAGILSSKGETLYSLESDVPLRLKLNPLRAMKTRYDIDTFQQTYFVAQSFAELFETLYTLDWREVRERCAIFPDIEPGVLWSPDEQF